jgi:hypothetical protein
MPRLDPATRNIAIGRLQAGESQNEVARTCRSWLRTVCELILRNAGNSAAVVDTTTIRFRR